MYLYRHVFVMKMDPKDVVAKHKCIDYMVKMRGSRLKMLPDGRTDGHMTKSAHYSSS